MCGGVPSAADWRDRVTFTLSDRARGEFVDWFGRPTASRRAGAQRYEFFANQLRAGVRVVLPHVQLSSRSRTRAWRTCPTTPACRRRTATSAPARSTSLNTRDQSQGETFLKQGFVRCAGADSPPSGGGSSTARAPRRCRRRDARVAEAHADRRAAGRPVRLHARDPQLRRRPARVRRARLERDRIGARPTRGGFEMSANRELDNVTLAGLALTRSASPGAPPAERARSSISTSRTARRAAQGRQPRARRARRRSGFDRVHTVGGQAVTAWTPARAMSTSWAGPRAGRRLGRADHNAWAWAVEAGYQLPRVPARAVAARRLEPLLGRRRSDDGEHETFFQVMPTHASTPSSRSST